MYISAAVISSQLKYSHAGSYVKMEWIFNILGTVSLHHQNISVVISQGLHDNREALSKIEIHSILS